MNKYQREKAKRRKRLGALGVNFTVQKQIVKMHGNDLVGMDATIDAIAKMKELADEVAKEVIKPTNLRAFFNWIKAARRAKHGQ